MKPFEIVEIDVEPPRKSEALIRITYTSICHTDTFTRAVAPNGFLPVVLSHGPGMVVEVDECVTRMGPGDHVIPLYTAERRRVPVQQFWQD